MGQVALGIRSLVFRLAIFVAMAALLAWALGGTLLPRAETAEYDAVRADGSSWYWRLAVGGRRVPELDPLGVRWTLVVRGDDGRSAEVGGDDVAWTDVAGPVASSIVGLGTAASEGSPRGIWFAGFDRRTPDRGWQLYRIVPGTPESTASSESVMRLDSRLAVELQLARLAAGRMPLTGSSLESATQAAIDIEMPIAGD
ncbi:MAG: hypothetical protein AB8G96_16700 [Phycisphaerales bacterium]